MVKLVIGCGYLGQRVARRWREAGETVYALTRSAERADALAREGLRAIVADVTRPETLSGLPAAETVLHAIAYDPTCGLPREAVYVGGLRAALDALPEGTGRVLLTSSTGVYGPSGGQWVDEDTPCRPTREAGRAMLAAEEVLRRHPRGAEGVVLRLAGLYGPGRIPKVADLLAGRPLLAAEEGFLNLIHAHDAAEAILAAEARGRSGRTYLVSDGHPVPRREFYRRLAELLDLPPPRFVEPTAAERAHVRGLVDKRVRNRRLLGELLVPLAYPSYREGLAAVAEPLRVDRWQNSPRNSDGR